MSVKQLEQAWAWSFRAITIGCVVISINRAIDLKFDAATYFLVWAIVSGKILVRISGPEAALVKRKEGK